MDILRTIKQIEDCNWLLGRKHGLTNHWNIYSLKQL